MKEEVAYNDVYGRNDSLLIATINIFLSSFSTKWSVSQEES